MALAEKRARRAPVQAAVLKLLSHVESATKKELATMAGASPETLRRLQSEGLVERSQREVLRDGAFLGREEPLPVLNREQQAALDGLLRQAKNEKPGVALLYGVTGSGKTSVYLKLIEACLQQGRGAMLMVPEIALTPQLVTQLRSHFGRKVAVLHSRLHLGERYDAWKRIRRGNATVVVGTRSAVFAPLSQPWFDHFG